MLSPLDSPREPLIPRMFYRRLLLLGLVILVALALPAVQLARLTIVEGRDRRDDAESKLVSRTWQSTARGRILDRHGLVLAIDRPAYDLAVEYPVITGQWAFTQAAARARKENRARWNELSAVQRQEEVDRWLPQYRAQLDAGWEEFCRLAEVSREQVEERKAAIVAEVSRQAANVWERQRAAREEELNRGRELAEQVEVSIAQVAKPIREQTASHVILRNVDDRIAFRFPLDRGGVKKAAPSTLLLPGVSVVDAGGREYPFDEYDVNIDRSNFPGPLKSPSPLTVRVRGVAVHMVGWMRDRIFKEDLERRPVRSVGADGAPRLDRGGYMAGDAVGNWGIEASAEDTLRGLRGLRTEHLDTGEVEAQPPEAGRDVTLTLDAKLQARIQALFSEEAGLTVVRPWQKNHAAHDGEHLSAAAVVLDVETGEVLAMVSTPTFTRAQLSQDPASVFKDEKRTPLLNRAVARPYPPGSIVKPLMLCAASAMGVWNPDTKVDCTGHLLADKPGQMRCWIYKAPFNTTHTAQLGHPLDASEAIMVSCNIYFYTVGRALGPERITEAYRMWGVGRSATRPDLGVGEQFAGDAGPTVAVAPADLRELGDDRARDDDEGEGGIPVPPPVARRPPLSLGEAILMGIGQGPVSWTPLHAADAYATLARGGVRLVPRVRRDQPVVREDLKVPPRAVELALAGLKRAVGEDRGTGHHITVDAEFGGTGVPERVFNVPGVDVWGKSGTADSGLKARDALGTVLRELDGRAVSIDHSWFVVLAGKAGESRPKYAVALVVENGGSGGRVAGPLCNQVLWALVAEGYL